MGCLGVHFSIGEAEVNHFRSLPTDDERLVYLQEELEDYFANAGVDMAESDKAWDAMHRALSDGRMTWDGGVYPLNHVVLAGEPLYGESDYLMSLKTPVQVRDIAAALTTITEEGLHARYLAIDPEDYGMPLSQIDWLYTWENFQDVRRLYLKAASEGRYILFTASQ